MDKPAFRCAACGSTNPPVIRIRETGHHYADKLCSECGRHNGFAPKPEDDPTKYKRPNAHLDLVAKYSKGFCELCGLPKDLLLKGQTLEAHHVIEFQDGGEPTRENIWILCTSCHKLVNHQRTYHRNLVQFIAERFGRWKQD